MPPDCPIAKAALHSSAFIFRAKSFILFFSRGSCGFIPGDHGKHPGIFSYMQGKHASTGGHSYLSEAETRMGGSGGGETKRKEEEEEESRG